MPNLQQELGTSKKTDTQAIAANSSSVNDNLSKLSANTFGVYETKQVVKALDTSVTRQTNRLAELSTDAKTNLESKTGMSLTDDWKLKQAIQKTTESLTEIHQHHFQNQEQESLFQAIADLRSSPDQVVASEDSSWKDRFGDAVNYTRDLTAKELIPPIVPTKQIAELQKMIDQDLSHFNHCPNLLGLLDGFRSTGALADLLKKLFGIVGLFDLKGILSCLEGVGDQLSTIERQGLVGSLVDQGSLNGVNDLTRISKSNGDFVDKYDSLRRLGHNRPVRRDPKTKRPNNTWRSPDVRTVSDDTFLQLGADQSMVFAAQTVDPTNNETVLNRVNTPVYDIKSIQETNPDNGFTSYALGVSEGLLRNIPKTNNAFLA